MGRSKTGADGRARSATGRTRPPGAAYLSLDIVWVGRPSHRESIVVNRWIRGPCLSVAACLAFVGPAEAEPWSRGRIAALPHSAFAVIETGPAGRTLRHLPHHDETGAVDPAHLRAALARLGQVQWLDPASAEIAGRHLEEHRKQIRPP